jgi:hypothetical protein
MSLGASLASAGISAIGGIASSAMSMKEARKNRAWQERMSNTAYQRQVKDLRKAGLNPMLAFGNSAGASTPAGAMGQITNSAKDAVDSFNATRLIKEQIKNIQADTSKKDEEADLINFQRGKLSWEVRQIQEQIKQIQNTAKGLDQENILRQMDVDLFQDSEFLKNLKTLGISPEFIKSLMRKGK